MVFCALIRKKFILIIHVSAALEPSFTVKEKSTESISSSQTSSRYRFTKCSLGCVVQFMNHKNLLLNTQYLISRDLLLSRMQTDLLLEIFSSILSCQNLHCASYNNYILHVSHAGANLGRGRLDICLGR
jgi:hypothetical protein